MRALPIFLLCCIAQGVFGQARNANWVFADGMWMAFTDSSMTMLPSPYSGPARNSCISDTAGQFLLLVDDTGVRNALFNLLPGATAMELGWTHPAANFMILPKPGMDGRYIILVNEEPPSSRAGYVEVDANGGAGAAIGGTTWYMDHATTKLSATTDAAEEGYWIVQHADSGDLFQVFHLTTLGLNPVPVSSHVGKSYLSDTPGHTNADRLGQMKLSAQGVKLAAITNGFNLDTNALELFHFDRTNGALEYWTRLGTRVYYLDSAGLLSVWPDLSFTFPLMCDIEFDPDGAHLYMVRGDTTASTNVYGVQISLEDPDSAAIATSAFGLQGFGQFDSAGYDPHGSLMLMGMNGLLYSRNIMYDQGQNYFLEWMNLPTQMSYLSGPDRVPFLNLGWISHPPYATNIGGFPNLCKRYLDSTPLATGIRAAPPQTAFRVHPNPLVGQAILEVNGPVKPTSVRWHDALGRLVNETPAITYGPSLLLDRKGLPSGMYMVEPMVNGRPLGFVRVLCE